MYVSWVFTFGGQLTWPVKSKQTADFKKRFPQCRRVRSADFTNFKKCNAISAKFDKGYDINKFMNYHRSICTHHQKMHQMTHQQAIELKISYLFALARFGLILINFSVVSCLFLFCWSSQLTRKSKHTADMPSSFSFSQASWPAKKLSRQKGQLFVYVSLKHESLKKDFA